MKLIAMILSAAIAASGAALGAQLLTERNISLQLARTLADASIACAKAIGTDDLSVAVVDRSGDLKLLLRADGANPHNAELARRKAYTARTFGVTTMEFRNRTNGTAAAGQRDLADVIAIGGGVPLMMGTERIGGLGLSGTPTQEDDDKCAHEALKAAAGSLK